MKKKILMVLVNISMGEIDWILPYMKYASKKYIIFTYFKNEKVYQSLKNNNNLFKLWSSYNDIEYIEKKTHFWFYKFVRKFLKLFNPQNSLIKEMDFKISNYENLKKIIKKKLKRDNFELKLLFSCFGEVNTLFDSIKKERKNKEPLIVHFPVSPMPYVKKKQKILGNFPVKMQGDLLLLGRQKEVPLFDKFISKKKIHVSGVPKFDKNWLDELVFEKKNDLEISSNDLKKKFIITFGYESNFENPNYLDKIEFLEEQLHDVMNTVKKFKNPLIIFKLHPRKNSSKYLDILKKYDKKIWMISKMHPILLARLSKCYLAHPGSSTLIDAVRIGTPTIQLWKIKNDNNLKYKEDTIFRSGLTRRVNNKNELYRVMKKFFKSNNSNEYLRQKKNFLKTYPYLNNSTKRINLIIENTLK